MEVQNKFPLLQQVFFIHRGKVRSGHIEAMTAYITMKGAQIGYLVIWEGTAEKSTFQEDQIFESKEDLLKSL